MAASGLTWLQIINRVLVRMREGTVAANNTTEYSTLVGQTVNAVKSEIEAACYWNALRDTFSVSATVAAGASYTLTSSLMNAVVIDGWNTTTGYQLSRGTNASFDSKFFGVGSAGVQTGETTEFIQAGLDSAYDTRIDIWPKPNATYALKFNVYVPQADLSADVHVPLIPQDVLIEETIARLKNERGDEDAPKPLPGETFILRDLLAAAVSRELGLDDSEMDWEPE